MGRERSTHIDFVRCISNYLVVILHAWAAFQYVDWSGVEFVAWTAICSHLSWMAIPTLFMISGYLLFAGYEVSKYPSKISRRVKRLALPYIAWNTLFVLIYVGLAKFIPRLSARVASFGLDSFSGAISKILSFSVAPIDGPLWYLRSVFILALVSPIVWVGMKVWKGALVLVLCAVWCVMETVFGLTECLHLTVPAYAIFCFVLGGVLSMHHKNLAEVFKCPGWLVVGVCACTTRGWIVITNLLSHTPATMVETVVISFLSVLEAPALLSLASHFNVERIATGRLYGVFQEMSFFAYAGHFLFCSIWLHALAPMMGGHWPGKFTVLVTIFVVFGMATMMALYYGCRKLFPKAMKVFDGTL